jgi:hypothetical protein
VKALFIELGTPWENRRAENVNGELWDEIMKRE